MIEVRTSFNTDINILQATTSYGGNIIYSALTMGSNGLELGCIENPATTPLIKPLTIFGQGIVLNMGASDTKQLRLVNMEYNTSGYLWVDSNGSLYWNSNLIAYAPYPPT
jgi:hypothetical protein